MLSVHVQQWTSMYLNDPAQGVDPKASDLVLGGQGEMWWVLSAFGHMYDSVRLMTMCFTLCYLLACAHASCCCLLAHVCVHACALSAHCCLVGEKRLTQVTWNRLSGQYHLWCCICADFLCTSFDWYGVALHAFVSSGCWVCHGIQTTMRGLIVLSAHLTRGQAAHGCDSREIVVVISSDDLQRSNKLHSHR